MTISLGQHIKHLEQKERRFKLELKTLALEVTGQFKDNIGKDRITPKTIKTSGKTLYDKHTGFNNIVTIIKGTDLITGNYYEYMQHHLTGTKHLPKRNWLKTPPDLHKIVKAWIDYWMKK